MPRILGVGSHVQRRQSVEIARVAVGARRDQGLEGAGVRVGGREVQGCRTLLGTLVATTGLCLEQRGDLRAATDPGGIVNRLVGRQCL